MAVRQVTAVYFSPTGGTRRAALAVARGLAQGLGCPLVQRDLTRPDDRREEAAFGSGEAVVAAMPTYAGRLPNKIAPELERILSGQRTPVVAVSVYGGRSVGDALSELCGLLGRRGFLVKGAAAAAAQHAFTDRLASGRPDAQDEAELFSFGLRAAGQLLAEGEVPPGRVGSDPPGPYYTPLQEDGAPAVFLKAKPFTNPAACLHCGRCASLCPMGSISREDPAQVPGICIKCQACVRGCPVGAKFFEDAQFLSHVRMLERDFSALRRENCFYLPE